MQFYPLRPGTAEVAYEGTGTAIPDELERSLSVPSTMLSSSSLVPVGVATRVTYTAELATTSSPDSASSPNNPIHVDPSTQSAETPVFVRAIMHRAVSTKGFISTVLVSATPSEISAFLDDTVSAAHVRDVWLAELSQPPLPPTGAPPRRSRPRGRRAVEEAAAAGCGVARYRYVGEREDDAGSSFSASGSDNDDAATRTSCATSAAAACTAAAPDAAALSSALSLSSDGGGSGRSPPCNGDDDGRRHSSGGAGGACTKLGRGRFDALFEQRRRISPVCAAFAAELYIRLERVRARTRAREEADGVEETPSPGATTATRAVVAAAVHSGNGPAATVVSDGAQPAAWKEGASADDSAVCGYGAAAAAVAAAEIRDGCGFGAAHDAVDVLCDGFAIRKSGKGLYRTALGRGAAAAARRRRPRAGVCAAGRVGAYDSGMGSAGYFEVHVVEDCGGDGMTVGVADAGMPLNKLIGSSAHSAGLHSSGQLVADGGAFTPLATRGFGAGDRVGVRVRTVGCVEEEGGGGGNGGGEVELVFYVNGAHVGEAIRPLLRGAEDGTELFAAVSLYRTDSKAIMRCCSVDWDTCEGHGDVRAVCAGAYL